MNEMSRILITLVHSAITGEQLAQNIKNDISEDVLEQMYMVANAHNLTHLVAHGLYKNGLLAAGSEICEQYKQKNLAAVILHERMKYDINQIYQLFEQQQLPFLPLKGAVLRHYYPEPWMRNSCDVDILVHPEDLERGIKLLCEELHYTLKSRDAYDVSLYSPTGMHLELHFALMEKRFSASRYLDKFWENAKPVAPGRFEHVLTDDMFYFHQVVHLAKHFVTSGCGIRLFLDLWILNHHERFQPTGSYVDYLENVGLRMLEQQARKLSKVWFSGEEHTPLTKQIESYVLESGIYGTVNNAVATGQLRKGSKSGYALSRIFLPYEKICEHYPVLKQKKYLTPIYQVKRWLGVIREGRLQQSVHELSVSGSMDRDTLDRVRDMMTKLDIV